MSCPEMTVVSMIYNDSNTNMSFVVHVSMKGVSMAVKHNEVSGLCSVFFFCSHHFLLSLYETLKKG